MRFALLFCAVCVGVQAGVLDQLLLSVDQVGHALLGSVGTIGTAVAGSTLNVASALHGAVDNIFGNLLPSAGRRRAAPDVEHVLQQGSSVAKAVMFHYADELQQFTNEIHSLNFLKGDVNAFMEKLQNSKLTHNVALSKIVDEVNAALTKVVSPQHKRSLLDSLTSVFGGAVTQATQLLNGVQGQLNSTASGLLGTVMSHVANLGDTLSHFKDTAANLLAQGQEGLAGITSTAHEYVNQAATGVQGVAAQTLDTILHPQTTK